MVQTLPPTSTPHPQHSPGTPLSSQPTRTQQLVSSLLGQYAQVDTLRRSVVRVRLTIKRCRFVTRFELDDLGVTVEDEAVRRVLGKLLIIGEKRLLPEPYMKKLNQVESGARYALKERAFRTELGSFVPHTNYEACKAEMESFKLQYFELRDDILQRYQQLKRQMLDEYDVLARDAFQRIRATRPDLLQDSLAVFVAGYCNRIAAQMPTPARIQNTFAFSFLPLDELLQFQVMQQGELASESVAAPVSAEQARRNAREQDWHRDAILRDLRAQAQERLTLLDSFCTSLVGQLRSHTYTAVTDVLATLQRHAGERFAAQSVRQLKNVIERVRGLNFYEDQDIDHILTQLHDIVQLSPEMRARSLPEIQSTLRAIATTCRATLLDLGEEPRSARALAIPDLPSGAMVREARATLGLASDPAFFEGVRDVREARPFTPLTADAASALITASLWDGIELGVMEREERRTR